MWSRPGRAVANLAQRANILRSTGPTGRSAYTSHATHATPAPAKKYGYTAPSLPWSSGGGGARGWDTHRHIHPTFTQPQPQSSQYRPTHHQGLTKVSPYPSISAPPRPNWSRPTPYQGILNPVLQDSSLLYDLRRRRFYRGDGTRWLTSSQRGQPALNPPLPQITVDLGNNYPGQEVVVRESVPGHGVSVDDLLHGVSNHLLKPIDGRLDDPDLSPDLKMKVEKASARRFSEITSDKVRWNEHVPYWVDFLGEDAACTGFLLGSGGKLFIKTHTLGPERPSRAQW